jgi:hypothetical protein
MHTELSWDIFVRVMIYTIRMQTVHVEHSRKDQLKQIAKHVVMLLRPFTQPVFVVLALPYQKLVASFLQREQKLKPVTEFNMMVRAVEVEVLELDVVDFVVQKFVLVQHLQSGVHGAP